MLFEVFARMERAKMWLLQSVDDALQKRKEQDRLRQIFDPTTREMLREDGYIELRRSGDWNIDNWL
jgi:hypothetical protein